jgi:hypothetical protein
MYDSVWVLSQAKLILAYAQVWGSEQRKLHETEILTLHKSPVVVAKFRSFKPLKIVHVYPLYKLRDCYR